MKKFMVNFAFIFFGLFWLAGALFLAFYAVVQLGYTDFKWALIWGLASVVCVILLIINWVWLGSLTTGGRAKRTEPTGISFSSTPSSLPNRPVNHTTYVAPDQEDPLEQLNRTQYGPSSKQHRGHF